MSMSEKVRPSALSALLTSKRFIVAACAAVAMVLGAMSGGASFFIPDAKQSGSQANIGIITSNVASTSHTTPSPVKDNGLTTRHAIEIIPIQTQSSVVPIHITPSKTSIAAVATLPLQAPNLFLSQIQLPPTSLTVTPGFPDASATSSSQTSASS